MKNIDMKKVDAIRNTEFFKAWRMLDGEILAQKKRLSNERHIELEKVLGVVDSQNLLELAPEGSIKMCKYLRDKHSLSLFECRDLLKSVGLWSPDWPDWEKVYILEPTNQGKSELMRRFAELNGVSLAELFISKGEFLKRFTDKE